VAGYREHRSIKVWTFSLVESGNFSLYHRVQTGSGTHLSFYPMGTRDSFRGGKAAGD
jgi:hypothetical protein